MPTVPCGIKRWSLCSDEERGRTNDLLEPKHGVRAQKLEEVVNAPNLDVVQNQQRSCVEMRIEKVVLKVRERVSVGTIDQGQLELLGEVMLW